MKRLLLVDDERKVAVILARGLRTLGETYTVDTATNGPEALKKIRQQPYDLLITDYKMPKVTGLNLAQWVRKISPQTHIILMTAHGTPALREALDAINIDGYIEKPFRLTQLRQMVERTVNVPAQAETEVADPPAESDSADEQAAESTSDEQVQAILHELQANTNAHCILLLSTNGYPVEVVGYTDSFDIYSMGGLIAANCSMFQTNYHEGEEDHVYSYNINNDLFLAVVFHANIKLGIIRLYVSQAVKALAPIAKFYTVDQEKSVDNLLPNLDSDFAAELSSSVDDLLAVH